MFRNLKYRIRILFEQHYFYNRRKIWYKWFDEETNKYIWSFERAKEYMYRWFEGEWDLLNILELKLVHIWYKLKKDGNHLDWYIDTYQFAKKQATDSDRQLFLDSIKHKSCYWLGNINFDNGFNSFDLLYESEKWRLIKSKHVEIPSNEIPESRKHYMFDIETESFTKEAPQYKISEKITLKSYDKLDINEIIKDIKELNIDIDVFKNICLDEQIFIVTPQNYQLLSNYLKSKTRGKREDLKELLHLRRLIKNVSEIDSLDDKYTPTDSEIEYYEKLGKDKEELYDKYYQLYLKDRKELYYKVANYIAEYGMGWWD